MASLLPWAGQAVVLKGLRLLCDYSGWAGPSPGILPSLDFMSISDYEMSPRDPCI